MPAGSKTVAKCRNLVVIRSYHSRSHEIILKAPFKTSRESGLRRHELGVLRKPPDGAFARSGSHRQMSARKGLAVQPDDVDKTVNAHRLAEVSCNTLQWFVRYCISGNDDHWNEQQNRVSSSKL